MRHSSELSAFFFKIIYCSQTKLLIQESQDDDTFSSAHCTTHMK